MFAVSSIVFAARGNNSLAIVDAFKGDTAQMFDTMLPTAHHVRFFLPFLCPRETFKGPVLSF